MDPVKFHNICIENGYMHTLHVMVQQQLQKLPAPVDTVVSATSSYGVLIAADQYMIVIRFMYSCATSQLFGHALLCVYGVRSRRTLLISYWAG